jgi:hypothetical protein
MLDSYEKCVVCHTNPPVDWCFWCEECIDRERRYKAEEAERQENFCN